MHIKESILSQSYTVQHKPNQGLQIGPYSFKSLSNSISAFFERNLQDGLNKEQIYQTFSEPSDIAAALYIIEFCKKEKLIHEAWSHNNERLLTFYLPEEDKTNQQIEENKTYTISRFTSLNWEENKCFLHSALSLARLTIHSDKIMQLIFYLTRGSNFKDLEKRTDLPQKTCESFAQLLISMKILDVKEDDVLKQWETHDLLYHRRTRCKSPFWNVGGTFRFESSEIKHLSAIKDVSSDNVIPLYQPSIEELLEKDMTLTRALETRSSIRDYKKVITLKELGEFLYRTIRIKSILKGGRYEAIKANYPSGGAIYEIETNLFIQECEGLERGVYHYDREKHTLSWINEITPDAQEIITASRLATAKKSDIQVLFVFTARFNRFAWKYESMAYSVMLKHVGVIMQTFYLVATAMGLSPSAVGCGDAIASSKALKTNFYEESSLGEFILGG